MTACKECEINEKSRAMILARVARHLTVTYTCCSEVNGDAEYGGPRHRTALFA